jgi:DNA invertase Pin-like site-specific DNA recombinase
MASLAEMEREPTIERANAGLAAARKQGRTGGRPRHMTDNKIEAARKLLLTGTAPRDVANNLSVSILTIHRRIPAPKLHWHNDRSEIRAGVQWSDHSGCRSY